MLFRLVILLTGVLCLAGMARADEAAAVDPRQVILVPDQEQTIRIPAPSGGQAPKLAYTISDYSGATVLQGEAVVSNGAVDIPVRLSAGYYRLAIGADMPIGFLVAVPAPPPDPFFGIDAALSWCAPVAVRPDLVSRLPHYGPAIARERLGWGKIEPAPGKWDWDTKDQYDQTQRLWREQGIPILEVFHDAPAWTRAPETAPYPADLAATALAWREIVQRWGQGWQGLEVWNEPDIDVFASDLPADQYVPIVKTVRYAVSGATARPPLGGGVIAYLDLDFLDLAADNGLLDACDFVSFHYYRNPLDLEGYIGSLRDWLARHGRPAKPLWLSEYGSATPVSDLSPESGRAAAFVYAADAVEARACGVARAFPFVYPAYVEKGMNHGLLNKANAPEPGLAAYAQAIRMLAGSSYLGDLRSPGAFVRRARVFASARGDAVVVLLAEKTGSADEVKLPFSVRAFFGIDGRKLTPAADGGISLSDGLVYAVADRQAIPPELEPRTEAARLSALAAGTDTSLPAASPIVLQPLVDKAQFHATPKGYLLAEGTTRVPFRVRVWNLSGEARTVQARVNGAALAPLPVPAGGSAIGDAVVETAGLPIDQAGAAIIPITATADGGVTVAPAAIALLLPRGLDAFLKNAVYQFAVPIVETDRWTAKSSGQIELLQTPGVAFSFRVTFDPVEKTHWSPATPWTNWAYPEFELPQEVDLPRVTGIVVRARCTPGANVHMKTMGAGLDSIHNTRSAVIVADGQWHVAYVPLDLSAYGVGNRLGRKISIGVDAKTGATLEVSDIYLVGK